MARRRKEPSARGRRGRDAGLSRRRAEGRGRESGPITVDGSAYTPRNLEIIRGWSESVMQAGGRIAIVDANGVLCSLEFPWEVNPLAEEGLAELENLGYSLVLWTGAPQAETSKFLAREGLLGYFSLALYAEQAICWNEWQERQKEEAIKSAPWLAEGDIRESLRYRLNPEDKFAPIFFESVVIFDDEMPENYLRWLVPSYFDRYPVVNPFSFGAYWERDEDDLADFSPELLRQVMDIIK